jgi:hypothetical protein
MDLGLLHTPPTTILLSVLGFSLLIAGVDFAKRRTGYRALARMSQSPTLDDPPKLDAVERLTIPVAEPETSGPVTRISRLPHIERATAGLPFGDFLPLPRPTPKMPQDWRCFNASVSWWREEETRIF